MQVLLKVINRKRLLIYIPKKLAILMAKFFQILPKPLLTVDQIKLLENDNLVLENKYNLEYLDINPIAFELVIPDYLKRFKKY